MCKTEKKIDNNTYVCPYCHPSGHKSYPKRELVVDRYTGLSYIGYVQNAKGEITYDDWYEKIQKPKDSCNIRLLLERAVQSDNTAILNQRNKVSADLSNLPNNLLDVLNTFQSVKNYFDSLPVEVKKDFSNNVYEYVKRSGKFSDELVNYYNTINSQSNNMLNNNSDSKEEK